MGYSINPWNSDKISEWKAMDIGYIGCRIHWNAMK